MKSARELDYRLHHLCIYDDKPRENMWPYLRWHHGITNYFSGAVFHVTGEGHSDYAFLGCGGRPYQVQIEAPPFQFEYERNWWSAHGRAVEKPVVRDGNIEVAPVLEVTLSFDHRVIDGGLAQRFMARIRETLEEPVKALL